LFRLPASRQDAIRKVDEEVRLHIELRAMQLMSEGMDASAAAANARRLFARDTRTLHTLYTTAIERDHHMQTRESLESLVQDLGYAARGMLRDPLLSGFMVVTLALGIGANTASLSLVDRLLLRDPAHVTDPDQLVRLYGQVERADVGAQTSSWIPYPVYLQLRDNMNAFESVGAYRVQERQVGSGAEARRLRVGQAQGGLFPVLGVQPLRGRFFAAEDDAASAGDLVILSEPIWRAQYGSDPGVLGRTIIVNEMPHTIVGIAPAGFTGTEPRRVDVWVLASSVSSGTQNWNIVGRLRPGVTADAASAEASAIHERSGETSQVWFRNARIFAAPIRYGEDGTERVEATMARWLAAVTTIVLLVAFANVVNLLLVRLARRRRELAIRVSLGSGRARVMRLVAAEGALLAIVSGVASLFVARVTEPIVRRALFAEEAGWTFTFADTRVLGLVAFTVLLTALCVGIIPAVQAGSPRLVRALRSGPQAGGTSSRTRAGLTVAQAALSVALLAGAGLFLRSLANVQAINLGVDRDRVITAEATVPALRSLGSGAFDRYFVMERDLYRRLEDALERLPGVEQVAVSIGLPLDGGSYSASVWVPGRDSIPTLPGGGPHVSTVTANYFNTVGTRILRGRPFTDADREGSQPVVIINETMAQTLWPGADALDQCVHIGLQTNPCSRIVGIAEDVHRTGLREEPSLQYYLALGQQSMFGGARLVVRPSASTPISWTALRQAILDVDPAISAIDIHWLNESLAGEMRPLRLGMVTFGMSGGLALIVAVLGLYSIMSYMVAWRTHEIGVRVALGATRAGVIRLVLRNGLALAVTGVAAGLVIALIGGRWLEPHLFDTSARDGGVLAAVAAVLIITAVVAGWVPALRATRISPSEALRVE
jgi:predicted permease